MAQQLIYTSSAKLLDAGRSGFGTVARSKNLSQLLVGSIERASQFSVSKGAGRKRIIFAYRRIITGNNRIHLLSRISDAGADYTGRTNHIAHHLVIGDEEASRLASIGITPTDILQQFRWISKWEGSSRFLSPEDEPALESLIQPIAQTSSRALWNQLTGKPVYARLLAWEGAPRSGVLIVPDGLDTLGLLSEAFFEFGQQSWSRTFTTALQSTDELSDFDWIISETAAFREIESRCGTRTIFDLTVPSSLPIPTESAKNSVQPKSRSKSPRTVPAPTLEPSIQSHQSASVQPKIRSGNGVKQPQGYRAPLAENNPTKNKAVPLAIGAACLALLVAGAVLWKTVANPSAKTSPNGKESATVAGNQKNSSKNAKEILRDLGFNDNSLEKFIQETPDSPDQWAEYARDLVRTFNKDHANLKQFREQLKAVVKPEGNACSSWLYNLHLAQDCLWHKPNTDLKRLQILKDCRRRLKLASQKSQVLAFKEYDQFYETECRLILDRILKKVSIQSEERDPEKIIKEFFSKEPTSEERNIFQRYIRKNFSDLDDQSLSLLKTEYLGSGYDRFKEALGCWEDPTNDPSERLKKTYGKDLVPKNFEQLLNQRHGRADESITGTNSQKPNNERPPQKPDLLPGIAKIAKVLVTEEELKAGVEVPMIKAWGKNPSLKMEDLKEYLTINDKTIPYETLRKVDEQDYYSYSFIDSSNEGKIKIYENGKFIPSIQNLGKDIFLKIEKSGDVYEYHLILNSSELSPLDENYTVFIKKLSEQRAEIKRIEELLSNFNTEEKLSINLEPSLGKELSIKGHSLENTEQEEKNFSLKGTNILAIEKELNKWEDVKNNQVPMSKPKERKAWETEERKAKENLVSAIYAAVGEFYFSEGEFGGKKAEELKAEELKKEIEELIGAAVVWKGLENKKQFNQKEKRKEGKEKRDYEKYRSDWDKQRRRDLAIELGKFKIENESIFEKIKNFSSPKIVKMFLEQKKSVAAKRSFQEKLESIKYVVIKTSSDRTLFRAKAKVIAK